MLLIDIIVYTIVLTLIGFCVIAVIATIGEGDE